MKLKPDDKPLALLQRQGVVEQGNLVDRFERKMDGTNTGVLLAETAAWVAQAGGSWLCAAGGLRPTG